MSEQNKIYTSKYFYLLIALISFFLINPFLSENHLSNFIIFSFFSFIVFLSVYVVYREFALNVILVVLASASFFSYWYIIWVNPSMFASTLHFIINIFFLGLITFFVIASMVKHKEITADTLCGAICGYLLIGFTWSFFYLAIVSVEPNAFSISIAHDSIRSRIDHFLYYSFVTLTTIGYGDIVAINSVARNLSWLEAVVGQVYLAVWISQLVGLRIVQQQKRFTD